MWWMVLITHTDACAHPSKQACAHRLTHTARSFLLLLFALPRNTWGGTVSVLVFPFSVPSSACLQPDSKNWLRCSHRRSPIFIAFLLKYCCTLAQCPGIIVGKELFTLFLGVTVIHSEWPGSYLVEILRSFVIQDASLILLFSIQEWIACSMNAFYWW